MASSSKAPLALFLALNLLMLSSYPAMGCGDLLSLGVCVDVLGHLLNIRVGPQPASEPCCNVIDGLVGLNANVGVCLCDALKLPHLLGLGGLVNALNIHTGLTVLLNQCGHEVPAGYVCGY